MTKGTAMPALSTSRSFLVVIGLLLMTAVHLSAAAQNVAEVVFDGLPEGVTAGPVFKGVDAFAIVFGVNAGTGRGECGWQW